MKYLWFKILDMMHMRKQIDEMINLANLRKERDYLNLDIQEMELRITSLKKYLGVWHSSSIHSFSIDNGQNTWVNRVRQSKEMRLPALIVLK